MTRQTKKNIWKTGDHQKSWQISEMSENKNTNKKK